MNRFLGVMIVLLTATAAHAQATPKNDQPVEVNADALEVLQQDQKAIFRGNVVAVQGEMRLKSDEMIVHYRKKEGAPADSQANTVSKLDVEGNVLLSTPEESASGNTGVYDVDKREIRLNGNVTLTRDQNILKGEHLVYNLDSGRSTLDGAAQAEGKARVRGLFLPKSAPKPEAKPAAKPEAKP